MCMQSSACVLLRRLDARPRRSACQGSLLAGGSGRTAMQPLSERHVLLQQPVTPAHRHVAMCMNCNFRAAIESSGPHPIEGIPNSAGFALNLLGEAISAISIIRVCTYTVLSLVNAVTFLSVSPRVFCLPGPDERRFSWTPSLKSRTLA